LLLVGKLQGPIGHGFSLRCFGRFFMVFISCAALKNSAGRPDNTRPTHKSDSLSDVIGNTRGCHVTSID
jgi:hypothetical protein